MGHAQPLLTWRWGTAYDLFISLCAIHNPASSGIRAQWAAAVRARLCTRDRETLEVAASFMHVPPCTWLLSLPHPCHAEEAIAALAVLPPVERVAVLHLGAWIDPRAEDVLREVSLRGQWDDGDRRVLSQASAWSPLAHKPQSLNSLLTCWADAQEFGCRYLEALRSYQAVFFDEEEGRLLSHLEQALEQAQDLSRDLPGLELVARLAHDTPPEVLSNARELVLTPSFWLTPTSLALPLTRESPPNRWISIFRARPADVSLVPGGVVPDALVALLKALSDPTRLRMLRLMSDEPLTVSQLAFRLRLRAPTLLYHLKTLHSSGLVLAHLDAQGTKRYTMQPEGLAGLSSALAHFFRPEHPQGCS